MFNATLYTLIISNTALMSYISNYGTGKAVFDDCVPQETPFPYVTIRILDAKGPDKAVSIYPIFIDYFDYGTSKVRSRSFANQLDILLEDARLSCADHFLIRISKMGGEFMSSNDPQAIHYNVQFTGRGDRKYWIDSLNK